jgi:cell division transport system permease protein
LTGNSQKKRQSASFDTGRRLRPYTWLLRHLQVALASLGRFTRSPLSSLMTAAVIAIALTLPTGLHLLLNNLQLLSDSWDGATSISIFIRQEVEPQRLGQLVSRLHTKPGIDGVRLITKEQALEEFQQLSGFSGALEALEENPLPPVVVVTSRLETPEQAQALLAELEQLKETDFAQLDMQWVRRFQAITDIAQRAILVLASLLGAAVLLVVVNTIRLEIQNRHAEIEITKQIGGTDAFIRRPFLYMGVWYGLFGGVIAWLLVLLSLRLLEAPVAHLAGLYQSGFSLIGMDTPTLLVLIGGSTLLGLVGSWIAVGRHLAGIEPD